MRESKKTLDSIFSLLYSEPMKELQRLREAKTLSRKELAAKADVSERNVFQLETTAEPVNTQARTRRNLAKALRCKVGDLFTAEGVAK
jgi:DNA-binding XRE family transcriptional regulator